ncbi:MAG: helix-turn-helix transcriptional regulator [Oscillibacter sp.]|nr:helix-turn-helix transcriptional regulator [uncultured Oscillibacter sp.]MCI8812650.1 helix-turn-helix transcriptional regulator [Oscillibacter sp.]
MRKEFRETQVQVASDVGIAERHYQKLECGENYPGIETVWKLTDHFNVTIDYLVGRTNDR